MARRAKGYEDAFKENAIRHERLGISDTSH